MAPAQRSPWWFVPVLYFSQGVPVIVVQSLSVVMYKKLGLPNGEIGVLTSLVTWPWVIKMLWGPLVDGVATKRQWVITMQVCIAIALGLAAVSLQGPLWLGVSLISLFCMAFLSATHDIAADGFYLLSMPEKDQAFFVGIRSAAFRLGTLFVTAGLVYLAGVLEEAGRPIPLAWTAALGLGAGVYAVAMAWNFFALPRPAEDSYRASVQPVRLALQLGQVLFTMVGAVLFVRLLQIVGTLLIQVMQAKEVILPRPLYTEFLYFGPRAMEGFGLELGFSALVQVAALVNTMVLFRQIGMGPAAKEFFGQQRILAILSFILFFRFGESMIAKMSGPFLLDPVEKGGLGLPTTDIAKLTGLVGVVALTLGGLLGGWMISRFGIKRCFWPMVLALNIPNLFYVFAAFGQWGMGQAGILIGIDQFGYGFGFSAYLVYLLFICQGSKLQTSLYAIATGLMALGAMIAGILSGFAQEWAAAIAPPGQGYAWFFVIVCISTIPGMLTLLVIPMDKADLKHAPVDID